MKYIGYIIIALVFAAGMAGLPGIIVIPAALLSALCYAAARRRNVKATPMRLEGSVLMDGVFLFFSQALILLIAWLLGVFFALSTPTGMLQRTIIALIAIGVLGVVMGLIIRWRRAADAAKRQN